MPPSEAIIITPVPSLVATLLNAEKKKGRPLSEVEVLSIADNAPCIAMPVSARRSVDKKRGYQDIDPENAWEEWCAVRVELLASTSS